MKQRILFLFALALVFIPLMSFGQEISCDKTYVVVEEMPVFGKGQEDVMKYFQKKLKCTKTCSYVDRLFFNWIINKDGKMIDVEVNGAEGDCKTALINIIRAMPNWTPGKQNGKAVCVKMAYPMQIHCD